MQKLNPLLIQDPPPRVGHDRGRDSFDPEALALSAFHPPVTKIFCIITVTPKSSPNGFPCFCRFIKSNRSDSKNNPKRMFFHTNSNQAFFFTVIPSACLVIS